MEFVQEDFAGSEIIELFSRLPMVIFYIKNNEGVFVRVNQRFEEYHGLKEGEGVGLTDYDLHADEIADRYRAEDQMIMTSGEAQMNRTWMVPSAQGLVRWWLSSKSPVRRVDGSIFGVAGVLHEVSGTGSMEGSFERIEPALTIIHKSPDAVIKSDLLARACHLSTSQFNRVFRSILGQSPKQYVLQHRLELAKNMLLTTSKTMFEIATESGFYDASDLGKHFKSVVGMTPKRYRDRIQMDR